MPYCIDGCLHQSLLPHELFIKWKPKTDSRKYYTKTKLMTFTFELQANADYSWITVSLSFHDRWFSTVIENYFDALKNDYTFAKVRTTYFD